MSEKYKPTTLRDYRELCVILGGGENNAAVEFFDRKIALQGIDAKVLANPTQMFLLIGELLKGERTIGVESTTEIE